MKKQNFLSFIQLPNDYFTGKNLFSYMEKFAVHYPELFTLQSGLIDKSNIMDGFLLICHGPGTKWAAAGSGDSILCTCLPISVITVVEIRSESSEIQ